jgi:Domain of unknown function (DUF4149)
MFRRAYRTRLDRILAAVEIPAIGLWLGALCGFAFISAPAAFRIVSDITQFADLTATNLRVLGYVGAICGVIAIVIALVRSLDASDRTNDIVRAALILLALLLVAYESLAIVPALAAMTDVHSPEFAALHQRSTQVYGGVVVLTLAALIMAAVRGDA